MPKRFSEIQPVERKVVCITGVSSGIGWALALHYARKGYAIGGMARNQEKLNALATLIQPLGVPMQLVAGDVAVKEDCERTVASWLNSLGKIDILINNAGISMRALFQDTQPEVLEKVMATNFWGTVYMTHAALPSLITCKGVVAGISSVAGFKGLPARTGYSASKFAMHGFFEALRIEHLHTGLGVVLVCPGFTASNIRQTALSADGSAQGESPRDEAAMMQPDEVAAAVSKAIDKRKAITVLTMQGKLTYWINKFFPSFVDGKVYTHLAKEADSPLK
jgi:dehydrogenase/reductase SDR family protein 7B